MVRDAILNTSDATSVAMRPFSQFTVIAISFLNVFHQSMQQKYIFIRKPRTTYSCKSSIGFAQSTRTFVTILSLKWTRSRPKEYVQCYVKPWSFWPRLLLSLAD